MRPPQLIDVGIEEHLGSPIDLNLTFIAENGYPVALRDYFEKGRPVILNLVYYNCPMLCTLVLNGQTEAMRAIPWTPGKEYEVVTITIDPRESFDDARKEEAPSTWAAMIARRRAGIFWRTTTGMPKCLAKQVGFNYKYDPAAGTVRASGRGDGPDPAGTHGALPLRPPLRRQGSALCFGGSIGRARHHGARKILLFCYHYDPKAGRYVWFALNIMRLGGLLTVALIAFFILRMFRAERARAVTTTHERFA